jgi:hypothetical protein
MFKLKLQEHGRPLHNADMNLAIRLSKAKEGSDLFTSHGVPQGCETSRLPSFLDNRLADGGEAVSFTRLPPLTPQKIPGTHFC